MSHHTTLRLLCMAMAAVVAVPAPSRVPKVYNALITSNQNLEPSKAYPVYQPVLHDAAFAFPFQPAVFYSGNFPGNSGLFPGSAQPPKGSNEDPPSSSDTPSDATEPPTEAPPTETPPSPAAPSTEAPKTDGKPTPAAPLPPNTQSPIPLNEFGLPPQVFPLGHIDPAYNGFTQVGPFTYTYPGLRFYDPYDPFGFSSYANLPSLYRPLTNVLSPVPIPIGKGALPPSQSPPVQVSSQPSSQAPPPEPSDLNVLNYSSKDPSIPNVPPPPLPPGGLKSDDTE